MHLPFFFFFSHFECVERLSSIILWSYGIENLDNKSINTYTMSKFIWYYDYGFLT